MGTMVLWSSTSTRQALAKLERSTIVSYFREREEYRTVDASDAEMTSTWQTPLTQHDVNLSTPKTTTFQARYRHNSEEHETKEDNIILSHDGGGNGGGRHFPDL